MRFGFSPLFPQRARVPSLWILAISLGITVSASAAPEDRPTADAILQLLQDKGLVPHEASTDNPKWVRQVRSSASEMVLAAMAFLGVPYRREIGRAHV